MSEDVIRIDNVEYEIEHLHTYCMPEILVARLRPKRKQTGWICTACASVYCLEMATCRNPRDIWHVHPCRQAVWRPFYGSVKE